MTILEEIAGYAKERVAFSKSKITAEDMKNKALSLEKRDFPFEKALSRPKLSFILECKKASPSKGIIANDFPYLTIAKEYETAGCDAISVLTEPKWFLGKNEYLEEIAGNVNVPVLRKDFTVDEYMIYEAKTIGADAVLLIVSLLSEDQLCEYIGICDELGLSALVEVHDVSEAETAVRSGARIVGVNNRNLHDFSVDTDNAKKLRSCIPDSILFVSESGVKDENDIKAISSFRADAVLIGETMMRAANKKEALFKLKGSLT